jgi:hypothetical protein
VKATVWGVATQIGGLAAAYSATGGVAAAHSFDDLALELPEDGVPVDLDHDQVARGELAYAELATDGRLHAVAVLDDGDWLEPVLEEREVFFSSLLELRGRSIDTSDTYIAREARLLGLSLTLDPATLGARPVSVRRGDFRHSPDRGSWSASWRLNDPLLARASDYSNAQPWRYRSASPARIIDRRPNEDLPPGLREGALVRYGSSSLPGGLRRGQPGRILSVR